ncbi:pro-resilin-like [Amphibalanus amphitrite]|uniref:pro-resilin-like n=1 Tax=Amphibalanus amphitrite TaxID=1232801 RepID=UPI001C924E6D|nr:pro-resilin-like [Amphibalanus amphitrite]
MKVVILAALIAAAAASGYGGQGSAGYGSGGYNTPTAYQFDYSVNDPHYGPQFSRSESNDGRTARGSYSVALPDGRVQHVRYYADQEGYGGFNAEVTYTGNYGTQSGYGAQGGQSYH